MTLKKNTLVQRLRAAADYFEAHPELAKPADRPLEFSYYGWLNGYLVDSPEGLAEFVRLVGGKIEKSGNDHHVVLTSYREGFALRAVATRESVCDRVQVGARYTPAQVIPDLDGLRVPPHTEPIYEWRMKPTRSDDACTGCTVPGCSCGLIPSDGTVR